MYLSIMHQTTLFLLIFVKCNLELAADVKHQCQTAVEQVEER